MKIEIKNSGKQDKTGLRRRWLWHSAVISAVVGLLCVLLITAAFSASLYIRQEEAMLDAMDVATAYFDDRVNKSEAEYYDACIVYTQTCDAGDDIDVQFLDNTGKVIASSSGSFDGRFPATKEVGEAVSSRGHSSFVGKDTAFDMRVMALSYPIIATSGDVIGVLRFAVDTATMDHQILGVTLSVLAAVAAMIAVIMLCVNFYAKSVLVPISQIVEKAQMITGGSYGIQLQTQYADEIGDLAQTINELSMRVNQNEKTQTEFISSLSHELRTPLTAIKGWSETILSGGDLDAGTARGMKIIQKEADRLTNMVLDLLDFTKIQDGRMTLNMETADLRGEFEDLVFVYGSRLAQEGIKLEYLDNDVDIPPVTCDPKRLRQVYLNILDNAAKHGGDGKRIEASIALEDGFIVVRIRDYGPGIPEDELSLVKKKFYKGSSKARGSGIGLAVCDEIVNLHGGTLNLSNAEGGGTVVTVSVPASQ